MILSEITYLEAKEKITPYTKAVLPIGPVENYCDQKFGPDDSFLVLPSFCYVSEEDSSGEIPAIFKIPNDLFLKVLSDLLRSLSENSRIKSLLMVEGYPKNNGKRDVLNKFIETHKDFKITLVAPRTLLKGYNLTEYKNLQGKTIILAIGATEQHGAHLPYKSDYFLAEEMTERAFAKDRNRYIILPIRIGNSQEHKTVGTLMLYQNNQTGNHLLTDLIVFLASKAIKLEASEVRIVNTHFGNDIKDKKAPKEGWRKTSPIEKAKYELNKKGIKIKHINMWAYGEPFDPNDMHAGGDETSIMMFLDKKIAKRVEILKAQGFFHPKILTGAEAKNWFGTLYAKRDITKRFFNNRDKDNQFHFGNPAIADLKKGKWMYEKIILMIQSLVRRLKVCTSD